MSCETDLPGLEVSLGDETAEDLQETGHTLVVALISDVAHILV